MLKNFFHHQFWKTYAVLIARILMGGLFLFAAYNKFNGMSFTAGYIASAGFPAPLFLAWVAAFFEVFLGLAILCGVYFSEATILAGAYVVFLGFAFHGPSHWTNPNEIGFFIDHFTMLAGLLFMTAHGPGNTWSLKKFW